MEIRKDIESRKYEFYYPPCSSIFVSWTYLDKKGVLLPSFSGATHFLYDEDEGLQARSSKGSVFFLKKPEDNPSGFRFSYRHDNGCWKADKKERSFLTDTWVSIMAGTQPWDFKTLEVPIPSFQVFYDEPSGVTTYRIPIAKDGKKELFVEIFFSQNVEKLYAYIKALGPYYLSESRAIAKS